MPGPGEGVLEFRSIVFVGPRYGAQADHLGRVDIAITVVDPTVTVEFVTPESLHVTLKLLKPNVLDGAHVTHGGRPQRMRLERSE